MLRWDGDKIVVDDIIERLKLDVSPEAISAKFMVAP